MIQINNLTTDMLNVVPVNTLIQRVYVVMHDEGDIICRV